MAERDWGGEYARLGRVWGDEPTPLGVFAADLLASAGDGLRILDVGCGYGRDSLFLARTLCATVVGVDRSAEAIADADASAVGLERGSARFVAGDFALLEAGGYDVVFAANLYQVLRAPYRAQFRELVPHWLVPGGLLLLGTLSVLDRQEYGKGEPVPGEEHSFEGAKFLHFSSREELEDEFGFLMLDTLREIEYDEPRAEGPAHHHVSWLLAGRI